MATARKIIKSAMRRAGILTGNENPTAEEAADGLEMLNDMLASWSNDSMVIYARTLENFPVSGGVASYTIGPGATFDTVRPVKIVSAFIRIGTLDYPLQIINDETYADIGMKSINGIPQALNFDNNYPVVTIKLYGPPDASYTLFLLSEKQLTQFTLDDNVDLPPGWRRALIYNLALELAPEYGQPASQEVVSVARESKGEIRRAIMAARNLDWDTGVGGQGNIYNGWLV